MQVRLREMHRWIEVIYAAALIVVSSLTLATAQQCTQRQVKTIEELPFVSWVSESYHWEPCALINNEWAWAMTSLVCINFWELRLFSAAVMAERELNFALVH